MLARVVLVEGEGGDHDRFHCSEFMIRVFRGYHMLEELLQSGPGMQAGSAMKGEILRSRLHDKFLLESDARGEA